MFLNRIDDKELTKIKGGFAMNAWIAIGIAAVVVFVSGIIEGISNPDRCNHVKN